jgi:hypothetical protein
MVIFLLQDLHDETISMKTVCIHKTPLKTP